MSFKSKHKLDFTSRPYKSLIPEGIEWEEFKVGTTTGLWRSTLLSYEILAVKNTNPGNGHFVDLMQWFEHSCRRDKKHLVFLEIMNAKLNNHLINKHGFTKVGNNAVKFF